ncbi:hypothetical protein IP90_00973 [Luteimonas cucumeris]|uniref:Uncharacterized protein n=1 Tax=Luteimonas cucumeris TaxID=985012 RepID=A0A562LBA7_9GAMM|nr:hypothetical protein [Luteimonas cucumeris]TWI04835.1 hypothetical protein IP90_00973 [Luteimonas cucumeris]
MIVIEQVDQVEVFVNENGTVTIKQIDPMGGVDNIICVPPSQVRVLCKALRKAAADAQEGTSA